MVTDPNGVRRIYTLGPVREGGPLAVTGVTYRKLVWDGSLSKPDLEFADMAWVYAHDEQGRLTETTEPAGRKTVSTWNERGSLLSREVVPSGSGPAVNHKSTWAYDPRCQTLTSESLPSGETKRWVLFPFDVASPGHLCRQRTLERNDVTGGDGTVARWFEEFDVHPSGRLRGLLRQRKVLEGGVTRRQYDYEWHDPDVDEASASSFRRGKVPRARLGFQAAATASGLIPGECVGDAPAQMIQRFDVDARGNRIRTTTERGDLAPLIAEATFDQKDRRVATLVDPGGAAIETRWSYTPRDQVREVVASREDNFTHFTVGFANVSPAFEPAPDVERRFYDRAGRMFARIRGFGSSGRDRQITIFGYDGRGNVVDHVQTTAAATTEELNALSGAVARAVDSVALLAGVLPPTPEDVEARGPAFVRSRTFVDAHSQPYRIARTDDARDPGSPDDDVAQSFVDSYYRDKDDNVVAFDLGRPGEALVVSEFDGHRLPRSIRTYDANGCKNAAEHGGMTLIREVRYGEYGTHNQPRTMEVFGDDGSALVSAEGIDATACATGARLFAESYTHDEWGRLRSIFRENFSIPSTESLIGGYAISNSTTVRSFDDRGLIEREEHQETGLVRLTDRIYTGQVCRVRSFEASGGSPAIEQFQAFDEAALLVRDGRIHRGTGDDADKTVEIANTYEYDGVGRAVTTTNRLGQQTQVVYDAQGRPRAWSDVRGSLHERRFDALGNTRLAQEKNNDGARGRVMTYSGDLLVTEIAFADRGHPNPDVGLDDDERHSRRDYVYDINGNVTQDWVYGRLGTDLRVLRRYDPQGRTTHQVAMNGVTSDWTYDAMGNPRSLELKAPWANDNTVPTPPGYQRAPVTQSKAFRHDGLGQLTVALDIAGDTAVAVTRHYESTGGVLEEHSERFGGPDASRTVVTRARYDSRGNLSKVAYHPTPADAWDLEIENDALDRVLRIRAPDHARSAEVFSQLDEITYGYAGGFPVRRTVHPNAEGRTLQTRWSYNELGSPYLVEHFDGPLKLRESRHWFRGQDVFLKASRQFKPDGTAQADASLTDYALIGASHVAESTNVNFALQRIGSYQTFADNALSSHVTGVQYNGFGQATQTLTTTYGAGGGRANLSFSYTTYDGPRRATDHSASFDPNTDKFLEARHTAFTYQPQGEADLDCLGGKGPEDRVCATRHLLLREPSAQLFELPFAATETTLGNHAVDANDRTAFEWQYTPSARIVRGFDGDKADGEQGRTIGDRPVHSYDLLDRLISTDDQITLRDGRCNDALARCSAGHRATTYDALDRRAFEDFDAPSGLLTERPRRFVYLGDLLLSQIEHAYTGPDADALGDLEAGQSTHLLHGANQDLPYANAAYVDEDVVPLENLDGGFEGFFQLTDLTLEPRGNDLVLTQFKPQPFIGGSRTEHSGRIFRWTTPRTELQPFDGLEWIEGSGFFKDFRTNHFDNQWHANQAFRAAIDEERFAFDIIAIVISAPLFAIAPFSIFSEVLLVGVDAVEIFQEIRQTGTLSWTTGLAAVVSLGGSFLGYLGDVADRAATAQRSARRAARAAARAAKGAEASGEGAAAAAVATKRAIEVTDPATQFARMGARAAELTEDELIDAILKEGRRITRGNPDAHFLGLMLREEGPDMVRAIIKAVIDDSATKKIAVIGRDNIGGVPLESFKDFVKAAAKAHGGDVGNIKSFLEAQAGPLGIPKGALLAGFDGAWTPHANIAWIEGIARSRLPVLLEQPLEAFKVARAADGLRFLQREFQLLAQRGYKLVKFPHEIPGHGYGMMVPPGWL